MWAWGFLIGAGLLVLLLAYLALVKQSAPSFVFEGAHAVITGGSSGIGKALAFDLVRLGTNVSIIARDHKKIDETVSELRSIAKGSVKVNGYSASVTDAAQLAEAIQAAAAANGDRIDAIVTSAGMSRPGLFEELPLDIFERLMNANYLGTVYSVRAALPFMKRHGGRVMLVSSMAGLTGVSGYTAYSASKFAVRGFAEALQMELRPHNIHVSLVNPPDVDTPMLREENKIKPEECLLISEGSGIFTAEQISADMIGALKSWKFFVNTGFDGKLIAVLTSGMSPPTSIITGLIELFSLGIVRVVSMGYIWSFNRITHRVHAKRQRNYQSTAGNNNNEGKVKDM